MALGNGHHSIFICASALMSVFWTIMGKECRMSAVAMRNSGTLRRPKGIDTEKRVAII
jgi:hypothetical protein